jgi:chromosome segregation ATPase
MIDKKAYIQKMQAKLDEWEADLDKMKAKLSGATADNKIKLNQHINNLESQCSQMKQQLEKLQQSGEAAWHDIQKGCEASWDKLSNAFKDAANKFK